jgi:hypothetical protein
VVENQPRGGNPIDAALFTSLRIISLAGNNRDGSKMPVGKGECNTELTA